MLSFAHFSTQIIFWTPKKNKNVNAQIPKMSRDRKNKTTTLAKKERKKETSKRNVIACFAYFSNRYQKEIVECQKFVRTNKIPSSNFSHLCGF